MNKLLLNLFALLLLPPGMAFGQKKPVVAPNPDADAVVHYTLGERSVHNEYLDGPPYHLTELQNSDTDTEVIAQLIEQHYHGDLVDAVRKVLGMLKGTYGLAVVSAICAAAQTENKWPAVQCSLTDLAVTPISPPQIPPTAPEKK